MVAVRVGVGEEFGDERDLFDKRGSASNSGSRGLSIGEDDGVSEDYRLSSRGGGDCRSSSGSAKSSTSNSARSVGPDGSAVDEPGEDEPINWDKIDGYTVRS